DAVEKDRTIPREKLRPPGPADASEPGPNLALADCKSRFSERFDQRHGDGGVLHLVISQEGREKLKVAAAGRLEVKAASLPAPPQDSVRCDFSRPLKGCAVKSMLHSGALFTPPAALLVHPLQGTGT